MSDARALVATERCRDLVARPERMGLERREGLEPLDVMVKFNRPAAHTRSAFQVIVHMKLSLDGSGNPPFTDAAGLVAEGRTEAECLEHFFNWMADENAVATFREVVKAHELDALAKDALAKQSVEANRVAARAADNNRNWAERKLDAIGRELGIVKPKVQA